MNMKMMRHWMLAASVAVLACSPEVASAGSAVEAVPAPRPWLGVLLGSSDSGGVIIREVIAESAAEKAGLEDGDRVLSVDGRNVDDAGELSRLIAERKPGDELRLEVERDGARQSKTVILGERRPGEGLSRMGRGFWHGLHGFPGRVAPRVRLGLSLQDLTPGLRSYFHVAKDQGVLVSEVAEESPAQRAGIKAGDVIVSVNGVAVGDASAVREAVARLSAGDRASLRILREGSEQSIEVIAEERKPEAGSCPEGCPAECCRGGCGSGLGWHGKGAGPGFGPGARAFAFEVDPEAVEKLVPKDLDERIERHLGQALEELKMRPLSVDGPQI